MSFSAEPLNRNPFDFNRDNINDISSTEEDLSHDVRQRRPSLRERRISRLGDETVSLEANLQLRIPSSYGNGAVAVVSAPVAAVIPFVPGPSSSSSSSSLQTPVQVAVESELLFENFLLEEIRNEGLEEPPDFQPGSYVRNNTAAVLTGTEPSFHMDQFFNSTAHNTPVGFTNPIFADEGRRLRFIADSFSRSPERNAVRDRASAINLEMLTQDNFMDLLNGLFPEGVITLERIVVLFFYCRDVAIRALRYKAKDYFRRFLEWSVAYIVQRICCWVHQHGGWAVVLSSSINYVSKLGAILTAIGITMLIAGIVLKWKKG